jgi:hypothetical protein
MPGKKQYRGDFGELRRLYAKAAYSYPRAGARNHATEKAGVNQQNQRPEIQVYRKVVQPAKVKHRKRQGDYRTGRRPDYLPPVLVGNHVSRGRNAGRINKEDAKNGKNKRREEKRKIYIQKIPEFHSRRPCIGAMF